MLGKMKHRASVIVSFRKKWWGTIAAILAFFMFATFMPEALKVLVPLVGQLMFAGMFMIFQFGILFWFLAGRTKITTILPGESDLTWEDYRGQPDLVEKAKQWVSQLTEADLFDRLGGEYQPGILMVGPPGSGKSYLAKVMAAQAGVAFLSVDAGTLQGMFMGIGVLKVMRMFSNARNKAVEYGGCYIFLDEIDAIGGRRSGMQQPGMGMGAVRFLDGLLLGAISLIYDFTPTRDLAGAIPVNTPITLEPMKVMMGGMGMGSQILNSILSELDGFGEKRPRSFKLKRSFCRFFGFTEPKYTLPRVTVIGASNRPDILDPALTRPGRLGKRMIVGLPDQEGLRDIAGYYLDQVVHASYVTPSRVAQMCGGQTPAFVRQVLKRDAPTIAAIEKSEEINWSHFQRAVAEAAVGDRQPMPLGKEEEACLAVHEAGHAIVLMAVAYPRLKPMYLTILRHGSALGHMLPIEEERWQIGKTRSMFEESVMIYLGGVVGEELFLDERHNSAAGDIPGIVSVLRTMFATGMFEDWPGEVDEGREKELVGRERKKLYGVTHKVLESNTAAHAALVELLLKQKELHEERIVKVVLPLLVKPDLAQFTREVEETLKEEEKKNEGKRQTGHKDHHGGGSCPHHSCACLGSLVTVSGE